MRTPPRHYDRPLALQILLAHCVPVLFGAVCGIALGASKPAYTVLSVVAAIGGFLAGIEQEGVADAASRGVAGGLLFGAGLLIAHEIAGTAAKVKLPDPEIVLVVVTMLGGAALGAAGGAVRPRLVRRAAR
ncbi:MAG TPA: hypothetical protein VIM22_09470 [Solirubrobacteraceae bacterium]